MDESVLHEPLLLESQGDVVVVGKESQEEEDKQRRIFKPLFLESQDHLFVSKEEDKRHGAPIRKVRFGLIALVLASIAAIIAFCNNNGSQQPQSDIDLLATVVMPGVHVSNLHRTGPQYRALEWLAYNDTRDLTIKNDATELLERFSLITLYYSVGGDSLNKSKYHDWSRWLTISSHCDWGEFNCDEDGRVTTLNSSFGLMHGTLPTEIGNLKRLRDLNLGLNELVGPIPSQIGHLQQLESLVLDGNKFSGRIPSEIGHLQQLETLRLCQNKLSGPIPSEIGNLQQLKSLDLHDNELSGRIPSEIGNLRYLHGLSLANNIGLTGTVPVEVGQLEIEDARFDDTSLTGGLDAGAFCKNRHDHGFQLLADCGGLNPKLTCECCTQCCSIDGNGRYRCDGV